MNIAIDGTALYGRYGGVEYALWNLLGALNVVDTRNRYTVYIPKDGPPREHRENFNLRWNWVRLPFAGADKARRIAWQQTQLPRQVRRDGCDILHAPTYIGPLFCATPMVLTVYDFIALSHPHFATRANRAHYGLVLERAVAAAQRVIVPSEAVQRELAWRVPQAKARSCVVPLGIEPIFLQTPTPEQLEEVRERYGLPPRFLLFVGNPEPKKNLRNLILALQRLPAQRRLPLIVTGGARAWTGYEIEAQHTPNTVQTLSIGYVRRRDLPALYALCEAFVFPSLAEGFGLPVLEALAAGAPVVASNRVPLPHLESAALICEPHDPGSIAKELDLLLGDADLRSHLRTAAREYACPFTWRRTAEMTLDVYELALRQA